MGVGGPEVTFRYGSFRGWDRDVAGVQWGQDSLSASPWRLALCSLIGGRQALQRGRLDPPQEGV